MPWQNSPEQFYRPALQGFWKQRVIGVGRCFLRNLPGVLPVQIMFINQGTHQLGDCKGRVCIIQLQRVIAPEGLDRVPGTEMPAEDIAHCTGDKKVFLNEPQLPPSCGRVGWIKHF